MKEIDDIIGLFNELYDDYHKATVPVKEGGMLPNTRMFYGRRLEQSLGGILLKLDKPG